MISNARAAAHDSSVYVNKVGLRPVRLDTIKEKLELRYVLIKNGS